jgi:hypothetical protein
MSHPAPADLDESGSTTSLASPAASPRREQGLVEDTPEYHPQAERRSIRKASGKVGFADGAADQEGKTIGPELGAL